MRPYHRARAATARLRRACVRASVGTARSRRRRAAWLERHARADRARPEVGNAAHRLRAHRQGNSPVDHWADLAQCSISASARCSVTARPTGWRIAAISTAVLLEAVRAAAPGCGACWRGVHRLRTDRGNSHPASCQRRASHRRRVACGGRRAFRDPPANVRRRPRAVHRHHGVARSGADGTTAAAYAAIGRHQLGRSWRPRRDLSAAARRIAEFRRRGGTRRLAGGILDRSRHARRMQS